MEYLNWPQIGILYLILTLLIDYFGVIYLLLSLRALLNWYSNLNVCAYPGISTPYTNRQFSVSNRVHQGGVLVLSPILFTVYIDDLLTELEKKGVGCYWNNHFVGTLCYADDIALLVCTTFCCLLLDFSSMVPSSILSHSARPLGHILSFILSDTDDIVRVKKDLVRKANCMLRSFSPCNQN